MAPGVQDALAFKALKDQQDSLAASIEALAAQTDRIETKLDDARMLNDARVDGIDTRLTACEQHLAGTAGTNQRTTAANAVRWVSNTWVRLAVAALAMMLSGAVMTGAMMSMVGTLISTGQWGPDDLRALLWW